MRVLRTLNDGAVSTRPHGLAAGHVSPTASGAHDGGLRLEGAAVQALEWHQAAATATTHQSVTVG